MSAHALPTLYIPHGGGPCFFMEWTMGPADTWDRMGAWLGSLGASLNATPKAVLVISGHWEMPVPTVMGNPQPSLIYDYYGFPEHTYRLEYPAPGAPALADEVRSLLVAAGIPAQIDAERGFDHGVFIPFKLIYPEANIPIVQLSLKAGLDAQFHLDLGRALAPLRHQGVLIVGSGMSFHNLRILGSSHATAPSEHFDAWLTDAICNHDADARSAKLRQWNLAPAARDSHPREEHLLPLMVVAGAAEADSGRRIFADRVMGAAVSAYQFGASTPSI